MKKILLVFAIIGMVSLAGCDSLSQISKSAEEILNNGAGGAVSQSDIVAGLKEALTVGIGNGATVVSKTDGYFKNPKIKIPFPPEVKRVETALRGIGLGSEVDKAVLAINRGAEDAAKSAKPIFVNAITKMTISDAMGILKGSDKQAATNYLKRVTSTELTTAFKPVIGRSLDKTLATKYWGDVTTRYNQIPMVQKVNTDLSSYVTQEALDGLFYMVGQEEIKIRENPVARITELLKKVFALQDGSSSKTTSKTSTTKSRTGK